jgi:hypothetical protein
VACNPLITPTHPGPGWMAWCKPCTWEAPERSEFWQAKNDKLAHQGIEREPAPPWIRGPR